MKYLKFTWAILKHKFWVMYFVFKIWGVGSFIGIFKRLFGKVKDVIVAFFQSLFLLILAIFAPFLVILHGVCEVIFDPIIGFIIYAWVILTHDLSKFMPDEFISYSNYLYGGRREEDNPAFLDAVKKHYSRNWHHPEYWNEGFNMGQPDSKSYILRKFWEIRIFEMLADWFAANKCYGGKTSVLEWFKENKNRFKFDSWMFRYIEFLIINTEKRIKEGNNG